MFTLSEYVNPPKDNKEIKHACEILGCDFKALYYKEVDEDFFNSPTYSKQANSNDIAGYENKIRNLRGSKRLSSTAKSTKYYREYDLGIGVIASFDYSDKNKSKIVLIPRDLMAENINSTCLYEEFSLYENMWEPLDEARTSDKATRLSPVEYFNKITSSLEAAVSFVKEKLAPYVNARQKFDISSCYAMVLAKETSGNHVNIGKDTALNYNAFVDKTSNAYGLLKKDIAHFIKTGELVITQKLSNTSAKPSTVVQRSSSDIQAEIDQLLQELEQAKIAEKKATYKSALPTDVYIWDMYSNSRKKGTWTSAEFYQGWWEGYVYETADKAINGGSRHLYELAAEDELDGDPDDYVIDAVAIPLIDVSDDTLSDSNLDHLI